jgi:acetyl-CoA acyltransferase
MDGRSHRRAFFQAQDFAVPTTDLKLDGVLHDLCNRGCWRAMPWPRCLERFMKQIQDPLRRSGRTSGPICGCAIPEAQHPQALNVARRSRRAACARGGSLAHRSVGGITVNRFCASGLSAVQMAADRIRVGEAEVMIAAGTESMSMVPMMGNSPSLSPAMFKDPDDEDYGIAYGMGLTAEKVAQQWKVSREAQDRLPASPTRARSRRRPGSLQRRDHPSEVERAQRRSGQAAKVKVSARTVSAGRGRVADTSPEGLAKLKTGVRRTRLGHCRQQLADLRRRRRTHLGQREGCQALRPHAAGALREFASKGVPPHIMGIGPIEAIPAALKARWPQTRRFGLD